MLGVSEFKRAGNHPTVATVGSVGEDLLGLGSASRQNRQLPRRYEVAGDISQTCICGHLRGTITKPRFLPNPMIITSNIFCRCLCISY